jgi:hypothetical protein
MEGLDSDLIYDTIPAFTCRDKEKPREASDRITGALAANPEYKPEALPLMLACSVRMHTEKFGENEVSEVAPYLLVLQSFYKREGNHRQPPHLCIQFVC